MKKKTRNTLWPLLFCGALILGGCQAAPKQQASPVQSETSSTDTGNENEEETHDDIF